MPAILLERLSYAYPPPVPGWGEVRVLQDLDLTVERGEFLALMGATGAGKTTLCLALNGLVPRATGGVFGGRAVVLGHDTRQTPVSTLAQHVGIVFQDPDSQLFSPTVEDELAFGPENLAVPRAEIAERVAWALDLVGLPGFEKRSPLALSGGQKQRVALAAALTLLPEVLILDEPTASLDPLGQEEVTAAIERLARQRRMTIVMASQDAERVAELSDRVAVLHGGRIARVDEPGALFADEALLEEAGLAAPEVSEVAWTLNRHAGTALRFARLDDAARTLAATLRGGLS